ncbi:MAG: hypothetical protein ACRYGB_15655 [Janthinobacterium lividum]
MKTKKVVIKTASLFFLMLLFVTDLSFAQGLSTPCNGRDPDVDCPIDKGIIVLAVVVVSYSVIKIHRNKNLKEVNQNL